MNEVKFSSVSYSKSSASLHIFFFCHILKLQPSVVKLVFKKNICKKKKILVVHLKLFFSVSYLSLPEKWDSVRHAGIPSINSRMCLCVSFNSVHSSQLLFFFPFLGWALQQTPDMIVRLGDSLTLNCSHKESGNWNMFWYKLPVGKNATLQLIVRSLEGSKAEFEEEFKSRFQSSGTKGNSLSMAIDHVLLNDSGTYFCAKQDTL